MFLMNVQRYFKNNLVETFSIDVDWMFFFANIYKTFNQCSLWMFKGNSKITSSKRLALILIECLVNSIIRTLYLIVVWMKDKFFNSYLFL